ncbi:MAG: hypothetical protein QNJ37_01240 [Crocosphaera sp.]|nr:hypothetical protein [Crocosphaera sp.]
MLLFVIIFNLVITCINCYLVFKLWQSYLSLQQLTYQLTDIEQQLNKLLSASPDLILRGQQRTAQLRKLYKKFLMQLAIAQKVFRSLKFVWKVWYRIQN